MAAVSQASPLGPARRRAQELVGAGDLAGARAVLEKAVELGKVNLAEDDPDVLLTAYELGTILQLADDPMAARRVLEETYASGLWRLGDSDPLMLRISHDIGVVAEELGNRHEARKAFTRVAELGPGVLGEGHPAVARARGYLGPEQPQAGMARPEEPRAEAARREGPAAVVVPVVEEPTTALPVVEQSPMVQPPSPGNQRTWVAEEQARIPQQRWSQVEEPTIAQPVVAPGPGPTAAYPPAQVFGGGVPQQPVMEGPPYPQGGASPAYGKKGLGIFAAIAAVLAAVIAVAALVFVLANRTGEPARDPDVPTLGGAAPGDVRLKDGGSAITVTWADPSEGSVSFMVTMGRPGQELKPVSTLGPGQTSFEMSGLNGELNYCFAVVAVYRNNQFATSPQACTSRATATPR
ncbi:hypothetical protein SAMN05421748_102418 [Paractinoplanes atraurantiacus]|uniref:Fibronectin type-III domain-containing protein n=1 Tax=Paractinoplanes atraurantiacus TaxID=1036182 RepID=A0A285GU60_9ACTN|nr:hypothetical protein SAMN05421748_102418 [Actinoplanes atraurantiacus]